MVENEGWRGHDDVNRQKDGSGVDCEDVRGLAEQTHCIPHDNACVPTFLIN